MITKKHLTLVATGLALVLSACNTPASTPNSNAPSSGGSPAVTSKTAATPSTDTKTTSPSPEAEANAVPSWQEYKSEPGKFSVQMPNKPQEQTQNQKDVKLNIVAAEVGPSAYFVGYADFPNKVQEAEIQAGLTQSVKGAMTNLQGEIKTEKETKLDGYPCRDFDGVGKIDKVEINIKGRFCFVENRLYQVFALGDKTKISPADVDKFIESFKLLKV
jgi:hypothetical protein